MDKMYYKVNFKQFEFSFRSPWLVDLSKLKNSIYPTFTIAGERLDEFIPFPCTVARSEMQINFTQDSNFRFISYGNKRYATPTFFHYTYAHKYMHTRIHTHICIRTHTHTHTHTYSHTHTHTYAHSLTYPPRIYIFIRLVQYFQIYQ